MFNEQDFNRNLDPRLRGDYGPLDQLYQPDVNITSPAYTFNQLGADVDNVYGHEEETYQHQGNDMQPRPGLQAPTYARQQYLGPALDQIRDPKPPESANRRGIEQQERAEQLPKSAYRPQSTKRSKGRSSDTSSVITTSSVGTSSRAYSLSESQSSFLLSSMQSEPEVKTIDGMDCRVVTSRSWSSRGRPKIKNEYYCAVAGCKDGREDKSMWSFTKHWNNVHAKSIRCDVCGKLESCESHMERHKVTHTGVKNYQCESCGRAFGRKDTRDRHMDVHNDD